jgi:glycolate oxidase iron-sulfur subunit
MSNATALAAADQCVKCGLCLPHCPTYRLQRNEADGPRGRIALAQGLINGTLAPSARLQSHIDGCLACRACESACPAHVEYAVVLDAARAVLATPEQRQRTLWMAAALRNPAARALLRMGAWLIQRAGLQGLWPRIFGMIPAPLRMAKPMLHAVQQPAPRMALFTGCVGDVFERQAAQDSLDLFAAMGIALAVPKQQDCCGALYQHAGLPAEAAQCATRNSTLKSCCPSLPAAAPPCATWAARA